MPNFPNNLDLACPDCGRKLKPVHMYQHATEIFVRTCRSNDCSSRWQIKVEPRLITMLGVRDGALLSATTFARIARP